MAWVTKDSVEQYETPESKKEYTKQEDTCRHGRNRRNGEHFVSSDILKTLFCLISDRTNSHYYTHLFSRRLQ